MYLFNDFVVRMIEWLVNTCVGVVATKRLDRF